VFLQIIFELFHGHQNFSRLGSFLRSYDTGIRELVHDSGRAVETDFQHSLEHADRCLIFFDDKFSGFHEVIIAVISAACGRTAIQAYGVNPFFDIRIISVLAVVIF